MGLALLRTSAEGGRHAGITAFAVPMDAPGLVVQPMETIAGAHEFNDVFLDGAVLAADSVVGADASIAKILHTEIYHRISQFGARLASAHGPLPDHVAIHGRRLTDAWLLARAITISGGSSEVMRNIVAKRRLRLPSG